MSLNQILLKAFDTHLNMLLSDVEETLTYEEKDDSTENIEKKVFY